MLLMKFKGLMIPTELTLDRATEMVRASSTVSLQEDECLDHPAYKLDIAGRPFYPTMEKCFDETCNCSKCVCACRNIRALKDLVKNHSKILLVQSI